MKFKNLCSTLAVLAGLLLAGSCQNPSGSPEEPATPPSTSSIVTLLTIPEVITPVTGGIPKASFDANQYTGTISWSPAASGSFAVNTSYTATITLTAKTGYTLTGVAANGFNVTGGTATNAANSGVVTVVFPSTSASPTPPPTPSIVTLLAIPEVITPVTGGMPKASFDASQYTGTINWSPAVSGSFAANTSYTATITLTAKTGYTLTGVAANGFTVTGGTATNAANTGVVTVEFPSTSAPTISLLEIPGVTVPATGETPVMSLDNSEYTGTISWSPTVSGTFAAYTSYTATITLTAKTGYTMIGVEENGFYPEGASESTNPADSGVVTAVFPVTFGIPVSDVNSTSLSTLTLKAVQGGTFFNGTSSMTVSSFRMSEHEITGDQYASVMGVADPSNCPSVPNHPVNVVSWYGALVFCNKLSMSEGLTPVYEISGSTDPAVWGEIPSATNETWNSVIANWNANGYRLPTEAEWEFAARGGNGTHNYFYAGSNSINDVAYYLDNSVGGAPCSVGSKPANELGLHDMSGNVQEWCWDWYIATASAYPVSGTMDYQGPARDTADLHPARVQRGGGYMLTRDYCYVYKRSAYRPNGSGSYCGFRVVRSR